MKTYIQTLSDIKNAIDKLTLSKAQIKQIKANWIEEEYFWLCAQDSKRKLEIFLMFWTLDGSYFKELIEVRFCSEEQSPSKFMAMRFLMLLAEENYKNDEVNEPLIEITQLLTQNSGSIDWNKHGIDYLVSQTISYLPLIILDENYIKLLKRLVGLPNDISAYSITERLIPRSINEGEVELIERLICEFVLKFTISDVGSIKPYIDPYKTLSFIESDAFKNMVELLGIEIIFDWFDQSILEIKDKMPYEMSSISFPSIEDTDQLWDRHSFKYALLKFIRDAMETDSANADIVFNKLWNSDFDFYRRLAIHIINFHFKDLKGLFWIKLGNPFKDTLLKHELFVLLQNHSKNFSENEILKILEWLEKIVVEKLNDEETKDDLKRHKAIVIKEYLAALTDLDRDKQLIINNKLTELDKINPARREHPGYNVYSETKWGHDYPDTQEEFEKRTATTASLATYFEEGRNSWTKYEIEGQLERLQNKVTLKPEFVNDVEPIIEMDINAKSNIISGFTKAIETQKEVDLAKAFKIVESELQKIQKIEIGFPQDIFLGNTCWLLREIGKNNSLSVSDEQLHQAKDISLLILKLETTLEQRNQDIIFDIINSTRGKAFDAMLSLMLRNGRANPEKPDKWFDDVKEYYSSILQENKQDECFLYSVSGHLPHFSYLDITWLEQNIDWIFPLEDIEKWTYAMFFYTRLNSRVYSNLFKLLMSHGHYEKGIEIFAGSIKGVNDFVKHVIISHLSKYEGQQLGGENSLIEKVLKNGNKEQIKAIVNFLYTNDGYDRSMILPIWERIINSELHFEDKQEVINNLPSLISKIQTFDKKTTLLIESTLAQIEGEYDKHRSLEHVLKVEEDQKDILNRAKIAMRLFNQYTDGFYKDEIADFTRTLYNKDSSVANDFVNDLLGKGAFYLLEIYEEFNKHSA